MARQRLPRLAHLIFVYRPLLLPLRALPARLPSLPGNIMGDADAME